MTQLTPITANLASALNQQQDPSQRTRFKRQNTLNQQGQQVQQRINSGGSRTSLRDRRDLALINQGVDPNELRSGIRRDRQGLSRLMRESRRAFQDGDTARGEALRAEAESLRLDINDRFKLARPTLRDLPVDQQAAQRQQSRAALNAQLPAISEAAGNAVSAAESRRTNELANIGRAAYQIENGAPPPEGSSPGALADYAEKLADPETIDQVTRGVGLPNSERLNASRQLQDRVIDLERNGGVQFDPFTPQARADNPALVDSIRERQIRQATGEDVAQQLLAGSQNLALAQQQRALVETQAATQALETDSVASPESQSLQEQIEQQNLQNSLLQGQLTGAQLQDQQSQFAEESRRSDLTLDLGLTTGAASTIAQAIGKNISSNEVDNLNSAIDSIEQQLSQYEGLDRRDVASHILQALDSQVPGIAFQTIDIDRRSLLGGKSFTDGRKVNEAEVRVSALVSRLRALAGGVTEPSSSALLPQRPGLDAQEQRLAQLPG